MTHSRCCYWFVCLFAPLLVLTNGCGGAPTPELSPDGQGIVCDRFEFRWELDGTDLLLAIDTDLPDEGELVVSVSRNYYVASKSAAYDREYFSETGPVSRWRKPRRIILDANAWKADLTAHQNRMAAIGSDLAFQVARIEDRIDIRAVLHVNQDDPLFGGRGNPNLSGKATSVMGTTDRILVEADANLDFPLDGPPPSSRSSRAPYDGLVTGESYRLSRETPIMPEFAIRAPQSLPQIAPNTPHGGLSRTVRVPGGSVVRVVNTTKDKGGRPWYEVVLVGHESTKGWINSITRIGQQIDRVK